MVRRLLFALLAVLLLPLASARDEFPNRTEDGLVRLHQSPLDAAYRLPDATLVGYQRIALQPCHVAFRKNWQRDHNRGTVGLSNKISSSDMEKIQRAVAEAFAEVFEQRLRDNGYQVVPANTRGDDVLLLKPAIINLDVAAPDLKKPGQRQYTTSSGAMSLYIELYDGHTNALIAKAFDHQQDKDWGRMEITNSVTNRTDANRMLGKWADILIQALDKANP